MVSSTRWARGDARSERGAAAVEFAFVVPILFLLIFGLIQYGLYFFAYQGGSDAARSAARLSSVGNPISCADFTDDVSDQVSNFGEDVIIKRTYIDSDASGDVSVTDDVEVTVQFDSTDLNMPFLPFVNDGRVVAEATSRVEYVNDGQPEDCP